MERGLSMKTLYQAIIADCKTLLEQCAKDELKDIPDSDMQTLIAIFQKMIEINQEKGNNRNYVIEYLKNILSFIEKQNSSDEINENEIYSAYAFLLCLQYFFKLPLSTKISEFHCNNYSNFYKIIEKYGDYEILKENYEKNVKIWLGEKSDKTTIKKLYQILLNKKLVKKTIFIIKNEKTKKEDIKIKHENTDGDGSLNSNIINAQKKGNINSQVVFENIQEKDFVSKYQNKMENIELDKNIINLKREKEDNSIIKKMNFNDYIDNNNNNKINDEDRVALADKVKIETNANNNNIIKEELNFNNNNLKNEKIVQINNNDKEGEMNDNINNIIKTEEVNSVNTININNIDGGNITKIKGKSDEKNDNNSIKEKNYQDNNKKKEEVTNGYISQTKNESDSSDNSTKVYISNIDTVNIDNTNDEKNNPDLEQKKILTYEELVETVISLKNELNKTKAELSTKVNNLETNVNTMKTKINKLENNQQLMYYQISLLQSRDISKSIYHYFAEHLGVMYKLGKEEKPFYDLINIMDYLKGKNVEKYSEEEKKKLRKFFKVLFFVNKVHNRIIHNNLSTLEQNIINNLKYDDDYLLPLIPNLGYNQLFQALGYYIEDYIKDDDLKEIKDIDGESIVMKDEHIEMLLTKEEINDVQTIFSQINNFIMFCEKKTWDK